MNKIVTIVLVLLLTAGLTGTAGTIEKIYSFENPVITANGAYSTVSFEGTTFLGEPGKATLPFFPVKLLLPPGEVAVSISIKYEDSATLNGQFLLMPRQEVRPLSDTLPGNWLMDNDFYHQKSIYPSDYKSGLQTQFYNGCGIALSAFTPLRYIPDSKQVIYYKIVRIIVKTGTDPDYDQHQRMFYSSEEKEGLLKGLVQNHEAAYQYFSGKDLRTTGYECLIITKNQYVTEFDTLVNFYKPRGIRATVKSLEYITSVASGIDLQQKIRNYITSEYQNYGIDYVLLGGDTAIIPYRGFYCYVDSDPDMEDYGIPADVYYSALDGTWNTDNDNKWAEPDEDDLYPEVGIGRLTFSDTAELHNMLHKIILFQDNPVEEELSKPLLSGEWLYGSPLTWGSTYMKLLVGYHTDNGYATHGIPPEHPYDTLYDRSGYTWSKAEIISKINAGHPFVHHVGHANYTTVMRLYNSDITDANFAGANGITHNYTIVYSHGCICGGFDYNDCIGERMIGINNFAVAFIGNSRYGWFNQGTSDGPSEHYHREFVDALYYDSLYHIGTTHLKSKSETAPFVEVSGEFEPGATRWVFYDNNILGDPMMSIWTCEPYTITASYPDMIPAGTGNVTVHVSGPQGACKGFTCSIYRSGTLFGAATTNAGGTAVISIGQTMAIGPIWLVVSGYNILPQYFQIQVSDYWLGLTSDWNDPANWYSGQIPDNETYIIIPTNPVGQNFPSFNSGTSRQCKELKLEPGAQCIIGKGETFNVGSY
jgi:hypothetical protein